MTRADLRGPRLLLLLRAGDDKARRRLLAELRAQKGNVSATARAIGINPRTVYKIAARDPELGEAIRDLAQGREGSVGKGSRRSARENLRAGEP